MLESAEPNIFNQDHCNLVMLSVMLVIPSVAVMRTTSISCIHLYNAFLVEHTIQHTMRSPNVVLTKTAIMVMHVDRPELQ